MKNIVVWTDALLRRSPEVELRVACSPNISAEGRLLAWQRYEIKRAYESVCGERIVLDLNELDPELAPAVAEYRRLCGGLVLWRESPSVAPQPLPEVSTSTDLPDAA